MRKIKYYVKSAFHHIRKNKTYSFFSILGTALTFVFVNIILQIVYSQIADIPPNVYTERIISLNSLTDTYNKPLLFTNAEANSIVSDIKEYESFSLTKDVPINVSTNERKNMLQICYTNSGLWNLKQFYLVDGRFFTPEECENRIPVVLVRESVSKSLFKGTAIGRIIKIKKNEFRIIGVIKDYPAQIGPNGMPPAFWVPYTLAHDDGRWRLDILFSGKVKIDLAKQLTARSLNYYFDKRGEKSTFSSDKISTVEEIRDKKTKAGLVVFSSAIIFLLLLIPAINMLTLNMASINNRASEIAIQRAFGASQISVFSQVLVENILITLFGGIIGICLSYPFISYIGNLLSSTSVGEVSLTIGVNLPILVFGAFPLILLLSITSSGLPAYIIAKQNVARILKGGSKW